MNKKLGLSALTALVLSSMLGAGVFSLPQNMAAVASPSALLIGWGITGVGIIALACAFLLLSRLRPELDGGIYSYAREGFGELIGFLSAWGYWLCAVIANVSYLVIVFSALSFFTDSPQHTIFGEGNTWQSIVGASLLLWIVHGLILRGVQTAASINLIATLAKLVPLALFVTLSLIAFSLSTFTFDFSGLHLGVPLWSQVKDTMLITLWVFIGIEGAVIISGRAKNRHDVGRATLFAVLTALSIYLLVTLLSLGVIPRAELATFRNPSMASIMARMMGASGEIIIALGLIISVCGAYLSWTILAAEVPILLAQTGILPAWLLTQNTRQAPKASLWITNGSVQLALILIWLTKANYGVLLTIASEMILVPYLLVGAYLCKVATSMRHKAIGIGATVYGLWLLYASGPLNLMLSVVLYAPGILLLVYSHRHQGKALPCKGWEHALMGFILVCAIPAAWYLLR